jgi:hypothetical protein
MSECTLIALRVQLCHIETVHDGFVSSGIVKLRVLFLFSVSHTFIYSVGFLSTSP